MHHESHGRLVLPSALTASASVKDVVLAMTAYNGARLHEACRLFAEKLADPRVTIGWTVAGAMTPGGYHLSCLIPLMEAGFVDWMVTTGANIYHDLHYALGYPVYQSGKASWDDLKLREDRMIRIYDILFPEEALFQTDLFFQGMIREGHGFQKRMGTSEFYHLCGKYISERNKTLELKTKTLLGTAYELEIPIFTSSPGDSSIGMNIAAMQLKEETRLFIDSSLDVNETAALVYGAKKMGGKSAVVILGGGSPKNFALQTEPQIQQIFGLPEAGHDYFIQITDARPDTGGLSGATPAEAVTWGKIDPGQLPDTVVVYTDSTIALPILTAYALEQTKSRPQKRYYAMRNTLRILLEGDIARMSSVDMKNKEKEKFVISDREHLSTMGSEGFLALPDHCDLESSRVVIVPFGLERTTSYAKGTERGPAALIAASHQVELFLFDEYSVETSGMPVAPYLKGIATLEEPREKFKKMSHEGALDYLGKITSRILARDKFPLILGGEHSISVGAVSEISKKYGGKISILHFDAHSDFRDGYEGTEYSHACAMTLCLPYAEQIVSVGIRSHAPEAQEVVERHQEKIHIFWERRDIRRRGAQGIAWVAESLIELLKGKAVYLTFDVDVLDSGTIGSSTGTPEPGGLSYNEVLDLWDRVLPHVHLVGADFVEHRPVEGRHAPDFAVARLVYKLIGDI